MTGSSYTAKQGRRFALTLAIAFAVLAGISYWRGRELPPLILGGLASIALVSALVIPSKLQRVEAAWMKLAHAISRITTPIFMGIVYFVILTPIGLLRRLAGGNPLVHRSVNDSYWVMRAEADPAARRARMERQF
jgi:asparagine N-glycosylation enzyme membrane subunit Stt3